MRREELRFSMAIDLGRGELLVRPMETRLQVEPGASPVRVEDRVYRGRFEVIGRPDGVFTVVNELPVEDYLLGVVPNELGPDAFPEIAVGMRRALLSRFPYALYYRFDSDVIDVMACLHTRQSPSRWRSRG